MLPNVNNKIKYGNTKEKLMPPELDKISRPREGTRLKVPFV